jgi:ribosomal protein L30/L7E
MMVLGWLGIKLINKRNKINKTKMQVLRLQKINQRRIVNKANHKVIMKMKMINLVAVAVINNN